jgi:uncharacterized membrane protein YcaP (DUF421 family)
VWIRYAGFGRRPIDHAFTGAMRAPFAVGLVHVSVPWLRLRFVGFERIVAGTPTVVYRDGDRDETRMRRLRMQQAGVRTAARQQGLDDPGKVAVALVERDVKVSVIEED